MAGSNVSGTMAGRRARFLLVVDNDHGKLAYTSRLLQRLHYSVWTALSGREALEMATTAQPDLIITAQSLEDMPGAGFIRNLKQSDAASVPVIVLTDKSEGAEERALLAEGAVTCLVRPVKAEDLYRVIQVATEAVPRMNMRIDTRLPVMVNNRPVRCGENECASALSEQGLYVKTPDPYPLNTKLHVQFYLADQQLTADAVVIYRHESGRTAGAQPGMGLQFTDISRPDRARIRLFIRNEITRDLR